MLGSVVLFWALVLVTGLSSAQTTIQIGAGTTTTSDFPLNTCYAYNYSQQIYLASELNAAGAAGATFINKIRFQSIDTEPVTNWTSWTVYLGNTSLSSFASTSSWVPVSAMTQVFSGNIPQPVANQWFEITLPTPFLWDGTSNLVVAVDENSPSWNCTNSFSSYTATAASGDRGIVYYGDNTNINPASPPTTLLNPYDTWFGSNDIPQIQFDVTSASACMGTPTPGNTISSASSVCVGQSFTLSAQNATAGSGVTYNWESSPDQTTWTSIGTTASLTMTQTAPTYYQVTVTCNGSPATTLPVLVNMNSFLNCYCTSSANNAGDAEILNVTIGSLNNSSTCSQTGGTGSVLNRYSDYSGLTATLLSQGGTYPVSISAGSCGGWYQAWVKVFIDLDHDGSFTGANETVFSAAPNSTDGYYSPTGVPAVGNIAIPTTAVTGQTRMRVVMMETTDPLDVVPCGTYGYGETEDYIIDIVAATTCSQPNASTLIAPPDVCSGVPFVLSAIGMSTGDQYTYEWQSSPDGIVWTPLPGGTTPTFIVTAGQNTGTQYRMVTLCPSGGTSDIPIGVTVGMKPFYGCYCSPLTGVQLNEDFDNYATNVAVSSTSLNNTTTSASLSGYGYSQFNTTNPATTAALLQGVQYTLSVTHPGTGYFSTGWLDMNRDGLMDASESLALTTSGTSATGTFVIPSSAVNLGLTGLRVRTYYQAVAAGDACAVQASYETEDYIVDIQAQPSCLPPSNLTAVSTTSSDATFSWTASSSNPAFGYEYYFDVTNTPPTSTSSANGAVSVGVTTATITGLSAQTTYYIWIRSACAPSDLSPWSGPITVTTECLPIGSLPFTETFETSSTTQDCWKVIDLNADGSMWDLDYTSNSHGGAEAAVMYTDGNGGNNDDWLIMPAITLTGNQWLKYWYRVQSSSEPNDFEILLSTTGSTPADFTTTVLPLTTVSNTSYAENTINLSAYSGTVYIAFHVPSGGADGWRLYFDDILIENIPTCLPPSNLSPGTSTTTDITVSWTGSTSNPGQGYDVYYSTANTPPTSPTANVVSVGSGVTTATVSALASGTPYNVWVRANCGGGDFSTWLGPVAVNTLITNDEAASALPLVVNADYDCGNVTTGVTTGATTSADVAPSCSGTGINDDVWYSFTATNTDHRVTLYGMSQTLAVALYSGSIGNLTEVAGACAATTSTTTATNLYATGLTVGNVYYARVYTTSSTTTVSSGFTICVGTAPTSAPANDLCVNAINIGNSQPMMGSVGGATEDVAPCNGNSAANDVWYTFTTGSVAGNVTVTGITTYADIVMEAFTGTCGSLTSVSTCVDAPAIGTESFVVAALANTTYYIRVYGFEPNVVDQGTFTIQALGTPLAVKLSEISATNVGNRNRVDWITASETAGDRFELERSADGRNFSLLSAINVKGQASTYSYWDEKPVVGVNYYRLKMMDAAGSFTYSDIVTAKVAGSGAFAVEAYPNPVSEMLTVKVYGATGDNPIVSISDVTGKVVKMVTVTNNEVTVNMSGLAQGLYLVKYTDNSHTETMKVNKR